MQISEKNYSPSESTFRLPENEIITNENIKLVGFTARGFKIRFNFNDKNQYCTFSTYYDGIDSYALHEKFYGSKLWDYTIELKGTYYRNNIRLRVYVNTEFIEQYFGNSIIFLSYLILDSYKNIRKLSVPNIEEKVFYHILMQLINLIILSKFI